MSKVTGDILEVAVKHPLGNKIFEVKAAEDSTYDFGGFRSNDDANAITSGGTRIDQKNRVAPFFECTVICTPDEAKFLADLASHPTPGLWDVTHIAGDVTRLTGTPVGDIQLNRNTGQLTLKVAGDGYLEKIQ